MNRYTIATLGLLIVNTGNFIWMALEGVPIFNPPTEQMIAWGGNYNDALLQGEWWRLFTCMFLHSGFLHLIMNMCALGYVGKILEPVLGTWRFMLAYFASGLIGSIVSAVFHADTYIVSVGASGAIFGLFGALFAIISTKYFDNKLREDLWVPIVTTILINLVYGFQGNIDFAAHIGGLMGGLAVGYCLYLSMAFSNKMTLYTSFSLITAFTGVSLIVGAHHLKNTDNYCFNLLLKDVSAYEIQLQQFTNGLEWKTDKELVRIIDQHILPTWNQLKTIADQMNRLQLSGPKADARNYIVKLTYLQAEKFELMARATKENSILYYDRISEVNKKISALTSKP